MVALSCRRCGFAKKKKAQILAMDLDVLFGDEAGQTPLDGNKRVTDEKCEHIAEDKFDLVVKLKSAAENKFMDKDKGQNVDKAQTNGKSAKESKERKANSKDVEKKDSKEKSKHKGRCRACEKH